MKTDSATDPWKRIFLLDHIPSPFKISLGDLLYKRNDIISCWTGGAAWGCLVFIKRTLCPPCPRFIPIHIPHGNGDHRHVGSALKSELFGHLIDPLGSQRQYVFGLGLRSPFRHSVIVIRRASLL